LTRRVATVESKGDTLDAVVIDIAAIAGAGDGRDGELIGRRSAARRVLHFKTPH
jgi:hypothetical protein